MNGNTAKVPNVAVVPTQLTQVTQEVLVQMRNTFENGIRTQFLKSIGNNIKIGNMLKKAGFEDSEIPNLIQNLKNGGGLTGYQVHHKIPLNFGGTNDFENLILIKNSPFHTAITSFQNTQINIPVGQTQILNFPKIEGIFYSPPFIN